MSSTKASCFIGIHKAPPNLSRTEFEAKVDTLGDAIAALPVAQRNLLKLDIISQNTEMDKHMHAVGLPVPSPTVVISSGVYLPPVQMLKDPALQKLLAESDDFGFRKGATAFAADIITKIDAPGVTPGTSVICVYNRPPHLSTEQFGQQMEDLMDKITVQPIRDRFSNYSLWLQNDAVDKHLQALGYPAPEPLLVVRAEAEIFEHSEVGRLLLDAIRESDNPARRHQDQQLLSEDIFPTENWGGGELTTLGFHRPQDMMSAKRPRIQSEHHGVACTFGQVHF
ncbi:hypothetical protein DFH07DRAFT_777534 [Mycena maculata]|uniref:Uncharacterized protein n=1 Tax=Mycena maculata TaxID=230809 RepID=A0AAD7IIF8_9AGAR|nr:hypothetical protein DFH07DRAFT_777534 [Mycena maculata]